MGEGAKFILGTATLALFGVCAFLFMMLDYYIPSAQLELVVQGATADQAKYRMEEALHGCRRHRFTLDRNRREYTRANIGVLERSLPSVRNDEGWLGGTHVRCDDAGCTVSSTALIPSPRASGSCGWWPQSGRKS